MKTPLNISPNTPAETLVQRFKGFYGNLTKMPLENIESIYAENVIFRDPVHRLQGTDELMAYMLSSCKPLKEGFFEYLDELVTEDSAYIKWVMHFRHPRLGEQLISVRGMSHIQFDERIYFHEDSYDLGQMLYEKVPFLGFWVRQLKARLS